MSANSQHFSHAANQVLQIEIGAFQRKSSAFDPGEIEDVIDQPEQHIAVVAHGFHVLLLIAIKRGFVQADADWLPEARKRKYNWDRRSQVFVKKLT